MCPKGPISRPRVNVAAELAGPSGLLFSMRNMYSSRRNYTSRPTLPAQWLKLEIVDVYAYPVIRTIDILLLFQAPAFKRRSRYVSGLSVHQSITLRERLPGIISRTHGRNEPQVGHNDVSWPYSEPILFRSHSVVFSKFGTIFAQWNLTCVAHTAVFGKANRNHYMIISPAQNTN